MFFKKISRNAQKNGYGRFNNCTDVRHFKERFFTLVTVLWRVTLLTINISKISIQLNKSLFGSVYTTYKQNLNCPDSSEIT